MRQRALWIVGLPLACAVASCGRTPAPSPVPPAVAPLVHDSVRVIEVELLSNDPMQSELVVASGELRLGSDADGEPSGGDWSLTALDPTEFVSGKRLLIWSYRTDGSIIIELTPDIVDYEWYIYLDSDDAWWEHVSDAGPSEPGEVRIVSDSGAD